MWINNKSYNTLYIISNRNQQTSGSKLFQQDMACFAGQYNTEKIIHNSFKTYILIK